jgi:lipopolysaccharide biosynthesis glycosyltransferase
MNERSVLTVVSNADEKFFPGLAVAVASAVAAASGKCDYHFLILDGGLDPASLGKLGRTVAEIAARKGIRAVVERLEVDQSRLLALPERRGSRMTYAKLVLPEILPRLDSIVYLDADVLCFAGVEQVHPPENQAHCLLAGARDFFSVIEKDCPWLDQVPLAERRLPYLNCGVMWMNLKGLREMEFTSRSIAARAAIGNARQGDQSVFNFLCRGQAAILPDAINHRTAIGSTRPLCEGNLDLNLHYIGSPKPWLGAPKTSNWLAHCLWYQAQASLFSGVSPALPQRPPHDFSSIRRKVLFYSLLNPRRAAHYRSDLSSLADPGGILAKAGKHWAQHLSPTEPC